MARARTDRLIHPAGLPINASYIKALRRQVESTCSSCCVDRLNPPILLFAFVFYGVTIWIYDVLADRDPLRTYLWNIALIVLVLVVEQVMTATVHTRKSIERSSRSGWGKIRLRFMIAFGLMSTKPALYLFYLVALVVSRISALEPTAFSSNRAAYLSSIEGSLLLLVVFDKFVQVVKKDYTVTVQLTSLVARALRSRPDSPPAPHETTDRPR